MASAGDKGFASLRQGAGQDLRPLPTDLCGDAFEIRVQGFGQFRPGRLGPRGPEVSEGLDPTTAPLLVMPEIQVRPPADRLRRHATTDLHGLRIALTLLKVNRSIDRIPSQVARPLISTGNVHGGPAPSEGRWTSSWCPSRPTWERSRPSWRPRAIESSRRSSSDATVRTAGRSSAAASSRRSRPGSTPAGSPRPTNVRLSG